MKYIAYVYVRLKHIISTKHSILGVPAGGEAEGVALASPSALTLTFT
jgi:hypothetical protein